MTKKKVKVTVEIEVPFESYGTLKLDAKAETRILQYIRETVNYEFAFIPLIDPTLECSHKTKISIKKE